MKSSNNIHIWKEKYNSNPIKWIRDSVVPDLTNWGFNTIGWTQEVVTMHQSIQCQSLSWMREHYEAANMTYCHLLPYANVHQRDVESLRPDIFSKGLKNGVIMWHVKIVWIYVMTQT